MDTFDQRQCASIDRNLTLAWSWLRSKDRRDDLCWKFQWKITEHAHKIAHTCNRNRQLASTRVVHTHENANRRTHWPVSLTGCDNSWVEQSFIRALLRHQVLTFVSKSSQWFNVSLHRLLDAFDLVSCHNHQCGLLYNALYTCVTQSGPQCLWVCCRTEHQCNTGSAMQTYPHAQICELLQSRVHLCRVP